MAISKERLKKLYALAMRGVGGEQEQAQKIFDKLLKKSGLRLEDLDLDETKLKWFTLSYHGPEQKKLLVQVVYRVTGSTDELYYNHDTLSGRRSSTRLELKCTAGQKLDIDFLFAFNCRLFEEEKKTLLEAFIQKHEIFGKLKEGEKPRELSAEETLKLTLMMKGLSDEEPRKALQSNY